MKLTTFSHKGRLGIGIVEGDHVYRTTWEGNMQRLVQSNITPNRTGERYPVDEVDLRAPIRPSKIIAIGLNYADHAAESGSELPDHPLIFAKFPSSIIGPDEVIEWDSEVTKEVDWEVELAVVIGKKTRYISEENAMSAVFGYTVANDVSARDLQRVIDQQWTRAKSLETFCPIGPWLVTKDEIDDPHNLNLKTTINGEVMQDSNTNQIHFKIPFLVSYCSRMFTLEPGDLILTGTPPGVALGMDEPRWLRDGDEVVVSIEGIGELKNTCRVVSSNGG